MKTLLTLMILMNISFVQAEVYEEHPQDHEASVYDQADEAQSLPAATQDVHIDEMIEERLPASEPEISML